MPDKPSKRPTFKIQTVKGADYAYTRVDGRRHSLGRAGTPDAIRAFELILAEWEAAQAGRVAHAPRAAR